MTVRRRSSAITITSPAIADASPAKRADALKRAHFSVKLPCRVHPTKTSHSCRVGPLRCCPERTDQHGRWRSPALQDLSLADSAMVDPLPAAQSAPESLRKICALRR